MGIFDFLKTKDINEGISQFEQSGARSNQAVAALSKMGYTNVKNIGGINNYRGKVER